MVTLVGEVIGATIAPTLGGTLAEKYGLGMPLLMASGSTLLLFLLVLFLKETARPGVRRAEPSAVVAE